MDGRALTLFLSLAALLVVLLVLAYVLVQRLRRQAASAGLALADELAGLTVLLGPEPAEYAGGTAEVLRGRSRGVLVLTDQRLLFRDLAGAKVDIDLVGAEASVAETFEGMRRLPRGQGPRPHLVVHGARAVVVGYVVEDPERWRETIGRERDRPSG